MGRQYPTINVHCHARHGDGLSEQWDTDAPLDRHVARARKSGIGAILRLLHPLVETTKIHALYLPPHDLVLVLDGNFPG